MNELDPVRRRSPGYIRVMSDGALHGIACRLRLERSQDGCTSHQEWLWDAVISELEYRWRKHTDDPLKRCWCEFCSSSLF